MTESCYTRAITASCENTSKSNGHSSQHKKFVLGERWYRAMECGVSHNAHAVAIRFKRIIGHSEIVIVHGKTLPQ